MGVVHPGGCMQYTWQAGRGGGGGVSDGASFCEHR